MKLIVISLILLFLFNNNLSAQWQSVGGQARDVGVGANGTVWVIGWTAVPGGYNIARWNGNFWEEVPGGAVRIDVDPNGNPWIVNDAGLIFRWNGQTWEGIGGQARDVGIGANGTVWVIGWTAVSGGYNIARWNGNFWEEVPGGAVRIDVDLNGNPWIVNDAGLIFRWNGQTWQGIGGQAHDVGIGANGTVWVIGWTAVPGGYNIARWNGNFWEEVPGGLINISAGRNTVWGVNDAGIIFQQKISTSTGITITLNNIDEWLCPSKVLRGDREFDGHGPRVKCEVTLKIGDAGRALYADIYIWAQETTSDWSTTERRWSKKVYDAPYGKTITAINSDKASRTQFVSPKAGAEIGFPGTDVAAAVNGFLDGAGGAITAAVLASFGIPPGEVQAVARLITGYINNGDTVVKVPAIEGTLVKFFHIVGDTGGADISDDDNCNADTRIVKLEFNPVNVTMR